MIRNLITLILFFSFLPVFSQNEMKEINSIKSNINFLYATGTSSTSVEDATNIAKDLIAIEIEQWLKENMSDDVAGYVAKSKENISQINTKRGNLYRVFVFVKKADVLPYYKEEEIMVINFEESQKHENSEAATIKPSEVKNSIANNNPKRNGSAVDLHTTELTPIFTPSVREKILLSLHTFTELNDYINQGRESKDVINVGNYKNLPKTGIYYIFIHNKEGNIPAYIKMNDSKFTNMVTGKDDAITNYKGCGAIWIQLKQE